MRKCKNQPVFNFMPIRNEENAPKNGTSMMLMYIDDMFRKDDMLLFVQMCDAGFRMGRENEDYYKWNQCVYEDIDYKFYIHDHKDYIEPVKLYKEVCDYLYNNYKNLFYYGELSRHGNSFHFIFYFKVVRNKNNRMMCKAAADFLIRKAFNDLGYTDIINYPKVFDDCSDSFYQACFMTLNNYMLNKECDGSGAEKLMTDNYYSIKDIYDRLFNKQVKKERKQSAGIYNGKEDWEILFQGNNISYKGPYMNHHERWYLFKSLAGLFDKEKLKEEWENCAEQLPEGNNHTKMFYMNEPTKNNWYRLVDGNEYIDSDLLKQFGYDVKFINKSNKVYEDKAKKGTTAIKKEKVYIQE